jgi:hypothetical protein
MRRMLTRRPEAAAGPEGSLPSDPLPAGARVHAREYATESGEPTRLSDVRETLRPPSPRVDLMEKPVITRAWVIKSVTLYVLLLAVVWYLGWRYLGSGMTH